MITEKDKRHSEESKAILAQSKMPAGLKSDLADMLDEGLENLNGRSLEERVQGLARSHFLLVRMLITVLSDFSEKDKEENNNGKSWKNVIVETRWQWMSVLIFALFSAIFNPQIVELLKSLATCIGG